MPKPVKLRGGSITTEDIEEAIAWGRDYVLMLLVDTNIIALLF